MNPILAAVLSAIAVGVPTWFALVRGTAELRRLFGLAEAVDEVHCP